MREIKFRGRDVINGKWLFGSIEIPLTERSSSRHYILGFSYGQYQKHEVVSKTVGEYIGLKDKDDIEIYEGDIIEWGGDRYFVEYEEETARFILVWRDNEDRYEPFPRATKYLAVIGNIHDNAELLEQ